MRPLIESMLDTDLYKFTMGQCVLHHFPKAKALYRFECRNQKNLISLKDQIQEQVQALADISLTQAEYDYLKTHSFFKESFLNHLKAYRFDPDCVSVSTDQQSLNITIEGLWQKTIFFEVPLLAIVSELYGQNEQAPNTEKQGHARLSEKIDWLNKVKETQFGFTDFGTRRRYSKHWQYVLTERLKKETPDHFHATSNPWLAHVFDLPLKGTMAHEFFQACQVLAPNIHISQQFALETWYEEYQGELGIALSDTLTFEQFLKEFTPSLAQRYQGLRQDSGDPIAWGERALAFYNQMNISAKDKTFVFSDKLTVYKAYEIYQHFKDRVHPTFGIGTHLTHDLGVSPADIVIKLNRLNEQPVVKISDSPGKAVCDDPAHLNAVKKALGLS